jgi:hypothetical protein
MRLTPLKLNYEKKNVLKCSSFTDSEEELVA